MGAVTALVFFFSAFFFVFFSVHVWGRRPDGETRTLVAQAGRRTLFLVEELVNFAAEVAEPAGTEGVNQRLGESEEPRELELRLSLVWARDLNVELNGPERPADDGLCG